MRDLRRYADLIGTLLEALAPIEVPTRRRRFVGTSETTFDGSRFECLEERLPWSIWHDFQAAVADAEEVCQADFYSENGIPKDVVAATNGHPCRHLTCKDGAGVLDDQESGIYYFFI